MSTALSMSATRSTPDGARKRFTDDDADSTEGGAAEVSAQSAVTAHRNTAKATGDINSYETEQSSTEKLCLFLVAVQ